MFELRHRVDVKMHWCETTLDSVSDPDMIPEGRLTGKWVLIPQWTVIPLIGLNSEIRQPQPSTSVTFERDLVTCVLVRPVNSGRLC